MVLEATMIIVDNSESSRNGDYLPTRFGAQSEAVNMIFNAKTGANPESSVGLMTMGGKGPEVLVTLTTDIGKVLDGLHRTRIWGEGHLSTGVQVAGLALKHRQNKSQRQRIIVFTCSPIADDEKSLIKLAKRMKKNTISVDFIAFGDLESDTKTKLEAFNENVKGGEGSHLVIVPPGPNLLSDVLLTSPILAGEGGGAGGSGGENGVPGSGEGGAAGGAAAAGGPGFEFGIDPSVDPELAMALRMSMEEETNRLERQRREREEAEQKEKQEKERLEGIPEEGGAAQAQARTQGESSTGSGGGGASGDGGEKKEGGEDKKDGGPDATAGAGVPDADKMDTA
ncbi:hypothetical protein GJ744_000966 [Endocarpon pusillum]|uniref:VWFA domain-containing protein n=1 Tax=Endocarpon pusillum TaxID=364733 RepID=A0A8H7E1L4_9EURO|nr:hypothetical protein GJ744_000966 [Endocarpon pusillum]